jgi:hypothetical protein
MADLELAGASTTRGESPCPPNTARLRSDCSTFVVGGTNLLASNPLRYRQWIYGFREAWKLRRRCVLFGVGWWQYQSRPDLIARMLIRSALNLTVLQGVRDSYTVRQLRHVGVEAINIACPTLWWARPEGVSGGFHGHIVATVTDYRPAPDADRRMLSCLRERAETLRIWPQGKGDVNYVTHLGFGDHLIGSELSDVDEALAVPGTEYVGTRLHGGIRALWSGVPTVIVSIDNRAAEIGRDVGLWMVERNRVSQLARHLDSFDRWDLRLPSEAIGSWRQALAEALAT